MQADDPATASAASLGRSPPATDVLIVGAGPTGLMAAALLSRSGVSVRVIDKNPAQAKESRAFGVQARSMELFLKIGLADALLERGLMATGAQVFVDGRKAAELNFDDIGRPDTPYQFLLMVPQSEIEEVLVEDLRGRGLEVERGVEVTGLTQDADGVTVQARRGSETTELRGRYLIGADGAHSLVRKALGLSFEGAPYPQTFLLADCRVTWPLDYDHFKLFVHGRGFGIYLPLKGRDIARVMVVDPHVTDVTDPSIASQGSSAVSLDEIEPAFREATGVDVTLSQPVWTSRYRVHHRGVDRYRVGRAFVAGDAAHIHSPAGGQGMNTGLQDAANLAWKIALVLGRTAPPDLLDTYHSERWPVGDKVLSYTDRIFGIATSQSGWVAGLRNLVFPLFASTVSRVGTIRNRAFHFISELGIRYGTSEFVVDQVSAKAGSGFRTGLSAGHRAPNAAVARGRDVFDLIDGYRFHLLALSRIPLDGEDIGRLSEQLAGVTAESGLDLGVHIVAHALGGRDPRIVRAESGQVFTAYGLEGDTAQALYLVRPDGYIAWRTDSLDVAACRDFITGRFVKQQALVRA